MKRQQWTAGLTAALACIALVVTHGQKAQAQDFGGKPIRMIVGVVAGGATDVTARIIAQKLSESLGTPVVVENKPGAFFEPAYREVTSAAPDGHTIFMISASTVVSQPGRKDFPYDIRKLTAISEVSEGPFILTSRKSLGFKSVADLVAYGKKNPGKLSFGSGGGALVGDVDDGDAGAQPQQFRRERQRTAGAAARTEAQLARVLLAIGDEVGDRLEAEALARCENERPFRYFTDRRQLANVVGKILAARLRNHGARRNHEYGVAVRRRAGDFAVSRFEKGARLVLDNDRGAETFAQLLRDDARGHVGGAAGHHADDHADRLAAEILGLRLLSMRRDQRDASERRCKTSGPLLAFHRNPPVTRFPAPLRGAAFAATLARVRQRVSPLEISPPHVDMADRHRHHHHRRGVQSVGDESERHLVAFADAGNREVRRRAD